jgi:hypothetical protein
MKNFAVEIKRTSYYTINVEAQTADQAQDLAWSIIETDIEPDGDADWEVSDISEGVATDDTRSYGPQGETA